VGTGLGVTRLVLGVEILPMFWSACGLETFHAWALYFAAELAGRSVLIACDDEAATVINMCMHQHNASVNLFTFKRVSQHQQSSDSVPVTSKMLLFLSTAAS
jgi:hypothetical protein